MVSTEKMINLIIYFLDDIVKIGTEGLEENLKKMIKFRSRHL
jgi:hypothetical protein